jgi:hypothetical protein
MKKNLAIYYALKIYYALREVHLNRVSRVMKLSMSLLFLFLMQLQAKEIYSQTAIVQISDDAMTLKDLISEIEEQTDYLFVYSNMDIDTDRPVKIQTKSRKVSDILQDVFNESDITYRFGDNYISLRKKIAETIVTSPPLP